MFRVVDSAFDRGPLDEWDDREPTEEERVEEKFPGPTEWCPHYPPGLGSVVLVLKYRVPWSPHTLFQMRVRILFP